MLSLLRQGPRKEVFDRGRRAAQYVGQGESVSAKAVLVVMAKHGEKRLPGITACRQVRGRQKVFVLDEGAGNGTPGQRR